ncbi:MAG: response regulator [Pseudomonadales bacterium]|nr:response regulator [Pseudomonadales bacterium]
MFDRVTQSTPKVFIVDDDEAVRFAISLLVETWGLEAKAFASANEFVEAVSPGQEAGCLVLDLNMPEITGADLLEQTTVTMPVIVITGFADSPLAKRAREAGVQAVLKKPFNDEILMGHICQALGIQPS